MSCADRFILSPLGRKLPFGAIKLEHFWEGGSGERYVDHLGFGFTTIFDGEFVVDHLPGRSSKVSLDLAYNVTGPVVDIVPGVSFGVQDAMNVTEDGRRFFWVTTYDLGLDGKYNSRTPLQFSFGATAGHRTGGILSVSLPFSPWFRLLTEFDTGRITNGIEYKPSTTHSVRLLTRNSSVFWSASFVKRF